MEIFYRKGKGLREAIGYGILILILVTGFIIASQPIHTKETHAVSGGYVADAKTAIVIAEAVLGPIYGEEKIMKERPFKAGLENNIWIVEGTLYCGDPPKTEGCKGGTAVVEIRKNDGQILRVNHGK